MDIQTAKEIIDQLYGEKEVDHELICESYNYLKNNINNDPRIAFHLAFHYLYHPTEWCVEPDIPKAIEYFNMALENNMGAAAYWLGAYYEDLASRESPEHISDALKYYIKGAELGSGSCAYHAGWLYNSSTWGYPNPDKDKSRSYYIRAAWLGHGGAFGQLAIDYEYEYKSSRKLSDLMHWKWYSLLDSLDYKSKLSNLVYRLKQNGMNPY